MIVVCAWCATEDEPTFLRVVPPYSDMSVSHGMCDRHHAEMREGVRRVRTMQGTDLPRRPRATT
jgi:hypothetical protein